MKIAIFGGSFNPIHLGHIGIAHYVLNQAMADAVWLMVSPLNPLKSNSASQLLATSVRLRLARMATAGEEKIYVSDFETHLPLPSYTYNTLTALREQFPQHEFVLVVGEDNMQRFSQWYKADELKREFKIITYPRTDQSTGLPLFDISSTRIRESLRRGDADSVRRWLHPKVLDYLLQHDLF